MKYKRQGIQAAEDAVRSYENQLTKLRMEVSEIRGNINSCKQSIHGAENKLAATLLPALTDDAITHASQLTSASQLPKSYEDEQQKLRDMNRRLADIEQNDEYVRRTDLISPSTGTLTIRRDESQRKYEELREAWSRFNFTDFLWLYRRKHHRPSSRNVFQKFARTITLAAVREKSRLRKVAERLGNNDFEKLAHQYESEKQSLAEAQAELDAAQADVDRVTDLVQERSTLQTDVEQFDEMALGRLRTNLIQHLQETPLETIHERSDRDTRPIVAELIALQTKLRYFKQMQSVVDAECQDRKQRIDSISRVQRVWRKNPNSRLQGDKTKWLVTVPAMKERSTHKRLQGYQSMRSNVFDFDDYAAFSMYLLMDDEFCPYDAFTHHYSDNVIYDGFARQVLPEIAEFREAHHQDRPDTSPFQANDFSTDDSSVAGPQLNEIEQDQLSDDTGANFDFDNSADAEIDADFNSWDDLSTSEIDAADDALAESVSDIDATDSFDDAS